MNKQQQSGTLHLTQKTHYGLFLLVAIAKEGKDSCISIKTIAKENKIPFPFLQKIASSLQKGGIIEAERGKYGGYKLTKTPSKTTLKEIIETLEGPIALAKCFAPNSKTPCNKLAGCIIKNGLAKINEEIKDHLLKKTLQHFIS